MFTYIYIFTDIHTYTYKNTYVYAYIHVNIQCTFENAHDDSLQPSWVRRSVAGSPILGVAIFRSSVYMLYMCIYMLYVKNYKYMYKYMYYILNYVFFYVFYMLVHLYVYMCVYIYISKYLYIYIPRYGFPPRAVLAVNVYAACAKCVRSVGLMVRRACRWVAK